MTRIMLIGLAMLVLCGCEAKINGELIDTRNNLRLVERDYDLYVEDLKGRNTVRLTNSPAVFEIGAKFSKDGKYVVYTTTASEFDRINSKANKDFFIVGDHFYSQPIDKNDNYRTELSSEEYFTLLRR